MNNPYKNQELEGNIIYYQDKISGKILEKHESVILTLKIIFIRISK